MKPGEKTQRVRRVQRGVKDAKIGVNGEKDQTTFVPFVLVAKMKGV